MSLTFSNFTTTLFSCIAYFENNQVQEQFGLIGMPNTSYDLTRTKYYDPEINLTTQVEMRYGPYEFIGLPVVITRNHTICPSNFSEDVR